MFITHKTKYVLKNYSPGLEITQMAFSEQMIEQGEYMPTMERSSRTKGTNRYLHKKLDSPPGKYTEWIKRLHTSESM